MKNHKLLYAIVPLILVGLLLIGPTYAEVVVTSAYARASLPGAANSAAYMRLENRGDQDLVLVAAASERVPSIAMHSQVSERGMSAMRPLPQVRLKAGGTVEFEPGANHFMLMGITEPLQPGEEIPFILHFQQGVEYRFQLPIKAVAHHTTNHQKADHESMRH